MTEPYVTPTDQAGISAAAAVTQADPLAAFVAPKSESDGVMVDVEDPNTGAIIMRWRIARFGGLNNAAIVREERKLKAKLPSGVRRAIDAGGGDPEVIQRMNRQVFVRVSCLGWEIVNPALQARFGEFSHEAADAVLEQYLRMYDLLSEQAVDEANFAAGAVEDAKGN